KAVVGATNEKIDPYIFCKDRFRFSIRGSAATADLRLSRKSAQSPVASHQSPVTARDLRVTRCQ
ncbi:hypothetical protein, partial [Burkholderia mallei]|uniref:hypothetical protein n=1 Tax=Burkholderia mallei TaxID=13373 RepID=UPI002360E678